MKSDTWRSASDEGYLVYELEATGDTWGYVICSFFYSNVSFLNIAHYRHVTLVENLFMISYFTKSYYLTLQTGCLGSRVGYSHQQSSTNVVQGSRSHTHCNRRHSHRSYNKLLTN